MMLQLRLTPMTLTYYKGDYQDRFRFQDENLIIDAPEEMLLDMSV